MKHSCSARLLLGGLGWWRDIITVLSEPVLPGVLVKCLGASLDADLILLAKTLRLA